MSKSSTSPSRQISSACNALDAVDLSSAREHSEYKKKLAALQEDIYALTYKAWKHGISSTLVFEGDHAFFGPVVIDPPTGDAAVRLWELVTGWIEFPHLYELQRPKRPDDIAAIATAFRPYREARDWVSIQNETP